ncbi:hypothetical protein DFH07DRAFT_963156 [Mycena maculata]|uniref:Zn(2)-C6 fungal-type domain-containing protein n=1 Tax=Mycena maculata TaxID=230809 RepID=A0AAD7N512_9AGAR|nr:hypothetical protein DFH07DRAFT_963156 [Mycena maculata]
MSSGPETRSTEGSNTSVKKKQPRPCDMCRRRKRGCDGGETCSYCLTRHLRCTYEEAPPARGNQLPENERIADLKMRLNFAEAALWEIQDRAPATNLKQSIKGVLNPFSPPHPDDSDFNGIAESFHALSLDNAPQDPGFQGKSSAAMLVRVAAAEKFRANGSQLSVQGRSNAMPKASTPRPWYDHSPHPHYTFPEEDLMMNLVTLYFTNVNVFIPLLHRPTFLECIKDGRYTRHNGYASTVLPVLVKTSDGDGIIKSNCTATMGAINLPYAIFKPIASLAAEFLNWTSNPRTSWSIVGFGLRLAQDIGAHRKKVGDPRSGIEQELISGRILLLFDIGLGAALGRSAYLEPHQTDIGDLVECDDEYWIDTDGPVRQPEGQPPSVAFFNCMINLCRILNVALLPLYCTEAHLVRLGITDVADIAVDLEAVLGKWLRTIPPHLVWDPDHADPLFAAQSAALHCFYCYTRIHIHRPFLRAMHPAIQPVDAARACICIAKTNLERHPDAPLLFSQSPLFTSAMVLLLEMWDANTARADSTRLLHDIYTVIRVLKSQQQRWQSSAFHTEVLERLLSTSGFSTAELDTRNDPDFVMDIINPTAAVAREDSIGSFVAPRPRQSSVIRAQPLMMGAPAHSPSPPPRLASDAMPPVFAGDEEITARFHRPQNIP